MDAPARTTHLRLLRGRREGWRAPWDGLAVGGSPVENTVLPESEYGEGAEQRAEDGEFLIMPRYVSGEAACN